MPIELRINGTTHAVDVPPTATLLSVLRDDLGLTGTRYGCGIGRCGACFVVGDGRAIASCVLSVEQAARMEITTVEGLATPDALHPVQDAFIAEDAMQCGYCTSGMVLAAVSLLAENPSPSEDEIRHALEGNICRCTGYQNIVDAIGAVAR